MFYAFIEDNKLVGAGECRQLTEGVDNVEISEEVFRNIERYVWNGTALAEDPDFEVKRRSAEVRAERDELLLVTDRYMLADFPVAEDERELYRQYRQYLRDIPETPGFPDTEFLLSAAGGQNWCRLGGPPGGLLFRLPPRLREKRTCGIDLTDALFYSEAGKI